MIHQSTRRALNIRKKGHHRRGGLLIQVGQHRRLLANLQRDLDRYRNLIADLELRR